VNSQLAELTKCFALGYIADGLIQKPLPVVINWCLRLERVFHYYSKALRNTVKNIYFS
jgi:hypothetical protein